jgi:hypothetical protein
MLQTLAELSAFFWKQKKYWMIPLVAMMVLLGALQILQGTAFAPFIYALF